MGDADDGNDFSVPISNEIGTFFRGHNIIEYKSPEDSLNIDVFYKSMAYAGLYKSYGNPDRMLLLDDAQYPADFGYLLF